MDRRTAIALSMRRRGLPMDVIRDILREVYDAGRKARRALLNHIRGARIVNYMLWDMDLADMTSDNPELEWRSRRLIGQMTHRWLSLGSTNWSQRDIRRVERRGREINIRRWWSPSDGNEPFGWEQWGVGSRTRWPRWDGDNPYGYNV